METTLRCYILEDCRLLTQSVAQLSALPLNTRGLLIRITLKYSNKSIIYTINIKFFWQIYIERWYISHLAQPSNYIYTRLYMEFIIHRWYYMVYYYKMQNLSSDCNAVSVLREQEQLGFRKISQANSDPFAMLRGAHVTSVSLVLWNLKRWATRRVIQSKWFSVSSVIILSRGPKSTCSGI